MHEYGAAGVERVVVKHREHGFGCGPDRSDARARSSSAAACGRRSHATRREQPTSKNFTVIVPWPVTNAEAISRCNARDVIGSWNSPRRRNPVEREPNTRHMSRRRLGNAAAPSSHQSMEDVLIFDLKECVRRQIPATQTPIAAALTPGCRSQIVWSNASPTTWRVTMLVRPTGSSRRRNRAFSARSLASSPSTLIVPRSTTVPGAQTRAGVDIRSSPER